jgi:hypothetical protein
MEKHLYVPNLLHLKSLSTDKGKEFDYIVNLEQNNIKVKEHLTKFSEVS